MKFDIEVLKGAFGFELFENDRYYFKEDGISYHLQLHGPMWELLVVDKDYEYCFDLGDHKFIHEDVYTIVTGFQIREKR